jgi:hypothetical protein
MFTLDAIVPVTTLAIGALIGAFGCAIFYESRGERRYRSRFWQRLREHARRDGGVVGIVESVPAEMANPGWFDRRCAVEGDGSSGEKTASTGQEESTGARRRHFNERQPVWPTNPRPAARHRPEHLTDETREISRASVDAALWEVLS